MQVLWSAAIIQVQNIAININNVSERLGVVNKHHLLMSEFSCHDDE